MYKTEVLVAVFSPAVLSEEESMPHCLHCDTECVCVFKLIVFKSKVEKRVFCQ